MGKSSPLADIDAAVALAAASTRRLTWFERLPADAQEKFLAAREKFHSGGYGSLARLTLARALIDYAEKNGLRACDYKRMGEWLAKQN